MTRAKGERPESTYPDRHQWLPHLHPRTRRRYSGSRWGRRCICSHSQAVSLAATHLCGRRLRWRQATIRLGWHGQMDDRNHQAIGQGERLSGAAPQMGGRTDFCLARALSSARERLGAIHRLVNSLGPHRLNPHAHTPNRKILSELRNFRIRLSDNEEGAQLSDVVQPGFPDKRIK